jgi:hypothetical protein
MWSCNPAPPYLVDVQVRSKCVCVLTTVLGFRSLWHYYQTFMALLSNENILQTENIAILEQRKTGFDVPARPCSLQFVHLDLCVGTFRAIN